MMDRCSACNAEIPPNAHFCRNCGLAQQKPVSVNTLAQLSNPDLLASIPDGADHQGKISPAPGIPDSRSRPETPSGIRRKLSHKPGSENREPPGSPLPKPVGNPMQYPLYRVSEEELERYPTGPYPLPSTTTSSYSTTQYPPAPGGAEAYPGIRSQGHKSNHTTGRSALLRVSLIVLVLLLITGGGVVYILTHPRPTLSLHSHYMLGQTPVGADGTVLDISGQNFSRQTTITFLLDGKPAPDVAEVVSDTSGRINVSLPVTSAWPVGTHTLSVRDTSHDFNQISIPLEVVNQGQVNTPGPLGAPTDTASFTTSLSIHGTYEANNAQPLHGNEKLVITGHTYPSAGSICKANDTGHPHQYNTTTNNGIPLTEEMTTTCTGTYKSGTITYTQTLLTDVITLNDNGTPISCNLTKPGPEEHLTGSYTAQGTFHGTVQYLSFPDTDFTCNTGSLGAFQFFLYGGHGTWVGSITKG